MINSVSIINQLGHVLKFFIFINVFSFIMSTYIVRVDRHEVVFLCYLVFGNHFIQLLLSFWRL